MAKPKFEAGDIARIRTNLEGWSPAEWAALFKCGVETIRRILRHETYSDIGENPRLPRCMPGIDPIQASLQRVLYRSGHNPLNEEPSEVELDHAAQRLAGEAGGPANQLLSELFDKVEEAAPMTSEDLAVYQAGLQTRKAAEPASPTISEAEQQAVMAALRREGEKQ